MGITMGRTPPTSSRFCCGNATPRDQMAAFLHRAGPEHLGGALVW